MKLACYPFVPLGQEPLEFLCCSRVISLKIPDLIHAILDALTGTPSAVLGNTDGVVLVGWNRTWTL